MPQGSYTLSAKAFDNAGASAASIASNVTINATANQPPTVSLDAPANGASFTFPADIPLAATASDADGAVTKVEFYSGLSLIAVDTNGSDGWGSIWAAPPVGTYALSATAFDNVGAITKSTTSSVTVVSAPNQPPTISLASPANGASFTAPASIAMTATASDSDGTITAVEFYEGSTLLGSDANGADGWAITWNSPSQGTYALSAKATDNSGAARISNVNNITVTSANTVDVVIESPVGNAVIGDDTVLVSGTFSGPANTGVTVNGVIASVNGASFAVDKVSLEPGSNTLTVTATAPDGATITKTVTITSSGAAPISTTASPATGIAPLTVSFSTINPTGKVIQRIDLDFDNNGTIDATSLDPSAAITHTFNSPGIYRVSVLVSHSEGAQSQTVLVSVLDSAQMDQTFKAIWGDMHSALIANNKAQALRYLNTQAQAKYGPVFDTLMPYFPAIVASYSTLQQLSISGDMGEYAVNRMIDGQNRIFLIYFLQDAEGVWRLDSM